MKKRYKEIVGTESMWKGVGFPVFHKAILKILEKQHLYPSVLLLFRTHFWGKTISTDFQPMPSIHSLLTWHCIANGRKHTQLVKEWREIPFPSRLQLSSTLSKIQLFFSLNILGTAIKKRLLTTQLGTKKIKNKNVIHAPLAQDPSLQYITLLSLDYI